MAKFKRLSNVYTDFEFIHSNVQLEKGALLLDEETGNVIAQLRFCNYTENILESLYITIEQYDDTNTLLDDGKRVEYAYLDLCVGANSVFGDNRAIVLNNNKTRKIKVYINKYKLDNKIVDVTNDDIYDYSTLKSQLKELSDDEETIFDKYAPELKTAYKKICYPLAVDDVWFCSCGKFNYCREKCCKCKLEKNEQLEKINEIKYNEFYELNQKEEQKKHQLAERKKEIRKEKRKKVIKWGSITVAIIAIIVFTIIKITPYVLYKKAGNLLNTNKYEEAYNIYTKLGKFKDSSENALLSKYEKAEYELEQQNYQDAYDDFNELARKSYKDSYDKKNETYKHIHRIETKEININVGLCLDTDWDSIYHIGRTLSENVPATVYVEYNNDVPNDKVIVCFSSYDWKGSIIKWKKNAYVYKGTMKNDKLTGKGSLYYRKSEKSVVNAGEIYDTDQKIYFGPFKDGFFYGDGVRYKNGEKSIEATFENGNPIGNYTAYYQGTVRSTGTVDKNGMIKDTKDGEVNGVNKTSECLMYSYKK